MVLSFEGVNAVMQINAHMLDHSHLAGTSKLGSGRLASLCAAAPSLSPAPADFSRGRRRGGGARARRSLVEDEEERYGGDKCRGGNGDLRLPPRRQEEAQQPGAVLRAHRCKWQLEGSN